MEVIGHTWSPEPGTDAPLPNRQWSRPRRETKVMVHPQPILDFKPILFDGMATFLTRTCEAT